MDSRRFEVDLLVDQMQSLCELLRRQRDQSAAMRERSRQLREQIKQIRSRGPAHRCKAFEFTSQ
jgi:hypothetical protein